MVARNVSGTKAANNIVNRAAPRRTGSPASMPKGAGHVATKTNPPPTTKAQQQAILAKRRTLLAQRNANRAARGQGGTNANPTGDPNGNGSLDVGSSSLTALGGANSDMTGTGSGSTTDTTAIQAALDALTQQVTTDEQTLSQQQTTLDSLANSSGNAATPSSMTSTSGISGILSSTTGKLALVAALGVGGYFYLKRGKKNSAAVESYSEDGSEE